jgi:hypothetical protein
VQWRQQQAPELGIRCNEQFLCHGHTLSLSAKLGRAWAKANCVVKIKINAANLTCTRSVYVFKAREA